MIALAEGGISYEDIRLYVSSRACLGIDGGTNGKSPGVPQFARPAASKDATTQRSMPGSEGYDDCGGVRYSSGLKYKMVGLSVPYCELSGGRSRYNDSNLVDLD